MVRVEERTRGASLVVGHHAALSPAERARLMPDLAAGAELEWLGPEARGRLVAVYASRFPNSCGPELERRVVSYVCEEVAIGALAVARLG